MLFLCFCLNDGWLMMLYGVIEHGLLVCFSSKLEGWWSESMVRSLICSFSQEAQIDFVEDFENF